MAHPFAPGAAGRRAGRNPVIGGLVFQALLRNALAEPYILGISGGAAVGAILGIMLGLARYPGVAGLAFAGSLTIMGLVLYLASGRQLLRKDSLLLAGVMVNAFCSAVILFLISLSQDFRLHQIMFWLMGDLSLADMGQVGRLALILAPCFFALFLLSHAMNLLTMGTETAQALGLHVKTIMVLLLMVTSLMISASVAHCGLVGFVGLVMPTCCASSWGRTIASWCRLACSAAAPIWCSAT